MIKKLFFACLFCAGSSSFAAAPLISPLAGPRSVDAELKAVRSAFDIKSKPSPVVLNRATLDTLKKNDEHEFEFPNAIRHTVIFDRIDDHGGGIRSSVGYLKEHGKDYRVIITTGPGGAFGSIRTPETMYQIVPGLNGQDLLVDMTEEQKYLPPIDLADDTRVPHARLQSAKSKQTESASSKTALPGGSDTSVPAVTPTPQAVIDLMFVYTKGLAARLGTGLMTRLYSLVATANTAYADSEVAMTMRVVNATMVDYPDPPTNVNDDDVALDDITPVLGGGAGVFSNIESIRTAVGADLVALMRSGNDFGGHGIAWLATTSTASDSRYMYSVITGCVVGCDSVFIHEMSHNMGNEHDRATSAFGSGGKADNLLTGGAFSYSYGRFYCAIGGANNGLNCNPNLPLGSGGCSSQPKCADTTSSPFFVNPNNIGTIMSYFNPVTLKFSNPNIMCAPAGGGGISQPCGIAGSSNNALSMNNVRSIVAGVKPTQIATPPGAIQFAQSNYSFNETGGVVNIAVSRVGGSSGAVSVSYNTVDGTAKADFDYLSSSGTLNWANGDVADKLIPVTLVNDGVVEGGESFTVNLSNPTGAAGIFLGNPASVSVLINENAAWPPGGTMPTGYTTGVWDVETMASNCPVGKSPCLRSPMVQSVNQQTYATADLNYTATFAAGTISFDYRVSSLSTSFGILEFFVDPAAVNPVPVFSSAGGETGWLSISLPITAGMHTLRWRFKDRLDFACTNNNPGCADRAWIDNVVVPLPAIGSSTALVSTANPSTTGQSVTFTATVTGGAGTPTGVVTFRDAGNIITMPNNCNLVVMAGGTATCTTNALSAGVHAITAAYSGNSTYDVSTSAAVMQNVTGIVLTVSKAGTGGGNVVSNPVGIDTAINNNSAGFSTNTVLTLTQTPAMGSVFAGWSGACTGTGTCMVTMDVAKSVTATFNAFCTAGTFSATGFAPCTPASAGNFVAGVGAMTQTQCVAGTYQPNTGAASCLQATPGNFASGLGNIGQTACSPGTYQPNAAAIGCVQTNMGFFVSTSSATAQTGCSPGTYQDLVAQTSCKLAQPGSFVSTSNAIGQTQCMAGNYQPNASATSCFQASPGSFVAMAGATLQTQCAQGFFQPMSAATTCLPASPGNFVNIMGAIAQTACSPGNYQPAMATTTCLQASPGSFVSISQATAQTACSPGSYQDLPAQNSCKLAQPGFFVAGSGAMAQTACAMGTTSIGSGNIACVSILPSAPTMVVATPGNAQANIAFAVPVSDGGSPIIDYTATCIGPNTLAPLGTSSPIIVTGLTNGQNYSCSVKARNVNGSGPPSSPAVIVMPSAGAALALNSVVSRKNHPGVGDQDITLDTNAVLTGLVTVEPRTIGAGHQIVFRFNNTVTSVGGSATTLGSVTHTINAGNTSEVIVTLSGIADNRRATVSLSGVNGALNPAVSVGFLVGDVNSSRSVNASDISGVKAHTGLALSPTNFRYDLNVTGQITSLDVSAVKARSGLVIP